MIYLSLNFFSHSQTGHLKIFVFIEIFFLSAAATDETNDLTTTVENIFIADDDNNVDYNYGNQGGTDFGSPSIVPSPSSMTLVRATCGYPGSPRNGRVLHLLERYEEGMVITFECDPGYFLLGPMTRTCQSNNTWSGRMPICGMCFIFFCI